jgi:hypothetical protein
MIEQSTDFIDSYQRGRRTVKSSGDSVRLGADLWV